MLSPLWEDETREPRGKRQRVGGWKQRLEVLEAEQTEASGSGGREGRASRGTPSRLAVGHLLQYADGGQSAKRLQFHMHNAVLDDMRHPMVQRLGALPAGKNASGGVRDLMRELGLTQLQTAIPAAEAHTVTRIM